MSAQDKRSQQQTGEPDPDCREIASEVSSLLDELAEMARQISTQLDHRAERLQSLIQEADQRIAQLTALHGRASTPASHAAPAPSNPEQDRRYAHVYSLADEGLSPNEIAQKLEIPKGEVELILALRR